MDDASQLQNPYAYIDDADEDGQPYYAAGGVMPWTTRAAAPGHPSPSRQNAPDLARPSSETPLEQLLGHASSGNPYAHIDQDAEASPSTGSGAIDMEDRVPRRTRSSERTWAHPLGSRRSSRRSHPTDEQISVEARQLQLALWQHRHDIWEADALNDPLQVLDPAKALQWLGYRVHYRSSGLGQMQWGRQRVEVAGLLDPVARTVDISTLPSVTEQTFTLAHELGHIVLGNVSAVAHRDRALSGAAISRDPVERAADKFGAAFLMPERLVRDVFRSSFLTDAFALNDDTAFALCTSTLDEVQARLPTRRHLSRWLASTERYNGRTFRSLATIFRVSEGAMAIRLEELDLIEP
ncbi:ImmA/IrrE family metallo-endopeptidase [Dyella sp. Tek66A03]|uniref:ImmA/IrrE family metallo-endopeptidase n=1 Tax=Dyella sp. Tek66A03 TaxID=3458298 RepID=UPI00403E662E